MRPLEIMLTLLAIGAAVCLLTGRWRLIGRLLLACSVLTLVAHAIFEGVHWQMIPGYAAVCVLCLVALNPAGPRLRIRMLLAASVVLLAAASAACSFVLPMFSLPQPTGPYQVGTSTLYLKDAARAEDAVPGGAVREMVVQLWYPAERSRNPLARYRNWRETRFINSYQSQVDTHSRVDAPLADAKNPFPVVLFDPGWRGRRTQNTFLTEDLASHGYVVAAIDHPYNAGLVAFPDGRVIHENAAGDVAYADGSTAERVRAVWNHELEKWVGDERFTLDRLAAMNQSPGTQWYGRLNTGQVAAVGQSFGGAASTAVCAEDPRVRASVNMDGWFFAAIHMRGPHQPLLVMDAYAPDEPPESTATVEGLLDKTDNDDAMTSLRSFGGYAVLVAGVVHEDFTDQPLLSPLASVAQRGALPAWKIHNIVRAYVLAFLDHTMRGEDPQILHAGSRPFPEATLKVWPESKGDMGTTAPAHGQ